MSEAEMFTPSPYSPSGQRMRRGTRNKSVPKVRLAGISQQESARSAIFCRFNGVSSVLDIRKIRRYNIDDITMFCEELYLNREWLSTAFGEEIK